MQENKPNVQKARQRRVLATKNFNKLFCIGYNKTGTTTLATVLRFLGYRLPKQQEQEVRLTKQCFDTNYSEFVSFVSSYDAFQDMPFSQGLTYVVADSLFPNSKFILSERDPEHWFNSLTSFHRKLFGMDDLSQLRESDIKERFKYLYPGYVHENKRRLLTTFDGEDSFTDWNKLYDKDYYIAVYEERNQHIKKYFMNAPEKLLIVDITKKETTAKICRFLGLPPEFATPMPQANKT